MDDFSHDYIYMVEKNCPPSFVKHVLQVKSGHSDQSHIEKEENNISFLQSLKFFPLMTFENQVGQRGHNCKVSLDLTADRG